MIIKCNKKITELKNGYCRNFTLGIIKNKKIFVRWRHVSRKVSFLELFFSAVVKLLSFFFIDSNGKRIIGKNWGSLIGETGILYFYRNIFYFNILSLENLKTNYIKLLSLTKLQVDRFQIVYRTIWNINIKLIIWIQFNIKCVYHIHVKSVDQHAISERIQLTSYAWWFS